MTAEERVDAIQGMPDWLRLTVIAVIHGAERTAYKRAVLEEREACIKTCGEVALTLAAVGSFSEKQSHHLGKFVAALKARPQP